MKTSFVPAYIDFLNSYQGETALAYQRDLDHYLGWLNITGREWNEVTRATIELYVSGLHAPAPATVARKLSCLSGFYQRCVDDDRMEKNPVASVKRPKVSDDSTSIGLDKAELAALLRAAEAHSDRTYALISLLAFNGLRISEALNINIEDLTRVMGRPAVTITRKGGKQALVPLADRVWISILYLIGFRQTGPLFANAVGQRMSRMSAWRDVRHCAEDALPEKANDISPHSLRHTFVTLALQSGATLQDVQDAAGHASPVTTQRYNRRRNMIENHPTTKLEEFLNEVR